jgi:hypothetical protein
LYLPPDDDNYAHHGINNLVIKYSEFENILKLDDSIHKDSAFYKMNMLEGVLEDFLSKLNKQLEPLKDQIQNLDRFSLLFLIIGFLATIATLILFSQIY